MVKKSQNFENPGWNYKFIGKKKLFFILWILFYLHIEILHCGYYRVHTDIMVFVAGFCKRLQLDSSTYHRTTVAWPPRYHRTISDYHLESTSDIFHQRRSFWDVQCSVCTFYVLNDQLVCLNVIFADFRW